MPRMQSSCACVGVNAGVLVPEQSCRGSGGASLRSGHLVQALLVSANTCVYLQAGTNNTCIIQAQLEYDEKVPKCLIAKADLQRPHKAHEG
jgi:hypothetical protein